jgi:chemotaxis signal transduction protein
VTARLRVVAGGHELLLDSARVQRVWTVEADDDQAVAQEGSAVPRIDLAALLGASTLQDGTRAIVVYGDGAAAIGLMVDSVKGLVQLAPEGVAALPPLSPAFALLFDGIAVEPIDGGHPLCLRAALDPAALAEAAAASSAADGHG